MQEITIRDFNKETDEAFVIDSWMKSFYGAPFTKYISRREFKLRHLPVINQLLLKSSILMAVERENQDLILGYIVFEKDINTLHYVYVKEGFRGFGLCRSLILSANFGKDRRVTHLTDKGRNLYHYGFTYSPYF